MDEQKCSSISESIELIPPVVALTEELPFLKIGWEKFECLLKRILENVEGLRHVQLFGTPGQSQSGIDIIAKDPYGKTVALQSKRYQKFSASDMRKAVQNFSLPQVDRLIIAVACEIRETNAVNEFHRQIEEIKPVDLELWDASKLSKILREKPEIVIEFFGEEWASRFCYPYKYDIMSIPPVEAQKISEAISRTPEAQTGADSKFSEAKETVDPAKKISLIEDGQSLLRENNFSPYAELYEMWRLGTLIEVGRSDEVKTILSKKLWDALDWGLLGAAESILFQARKLKLDQKNGTLLEEYAQELQEAIRLYCNPLDNLPDVEEIRVALGRSQIYYVVLTCEIAFADGNFTWLRSVVPDVSQYLKKNNVNDCLAVRLRIVIAEIEENWADLLRDARKNRLGYDLAALTMARYARYCALNQKFEDADSNWEDAISSAASARKYAEAEKWVFNRRLLMHRNMSMNDGLRPLQEAIGNMSSSSSIIPTAKNAYEKAIAGLVSGDLRSAAISANKALRDAVIIGDLAGEKRIRRVCAKILEDSEEYEKSARNYARAEAIKEIENLGKKLQDYFVDIVQDLEASNYWTVGAVYRLLSSQADLIPDDTIEYILTRIMHEIESSQDLSDHRFSSSSRYNNAIKCLAGIVDRIGYEHAIKIIDHFSNQAPVEDGCYRFHDQDEAIILAKIALKFKVLAPNTVPNLVALLGRSYLSRNQVCLQAVLENSTEALVTLFELVKQGNDWAKSILVRLGEDFPEKTTIISQAFENLSKPLVHNEGVYGIGTRAVEDSLIIQNLSSGELDKVVFQLFERLNDPKVCYSNREEYLLAIEKLSEYVSVDSRLEYCNKAINVIESSIVSEYDILEEQFTHPLGFYRVKRGKRGDRAAAALVAATFAETIEYKQRIKSIVYSLLVSEDQYFLAYALYAIREIIVEDLGFLMAQGSEIRSLVAYLWVENDGVSYIGDLLARDPDVRVRRSLAESLKGKPRDQFPNLFEKLEKDPRFSVRNALHAS